jgi:hypothetical protein
MGIRPRALFLNRLSNKHALIWILLKLVVKRLGKLVKKQLVCNFRFLIKEAVDFFE